MRVGLRQSGECQLTFRIHELLHTSDSKTKLLLYLTQPPMRFRRFRLFPGLVSASARFSYACSPAVFVFGVMVKELTALELARIAAGPPRPNPNDLVGSRKERSQYDGLVRRQRAARVGGGVQPPPR